MTGCDETAHVLVGEENVAQSGVRSAPGPILDTRTWYNRSIDRGWESHKWSEAFILARRILEIPSRSKNTSSPCKARFVGNVFYACANLRGGGGGIHLKSKLHLNAWIASTCAYRSNWSRTKQKMSRHRSILSKPSIVC